MREVMNTFRKSRRKRAALGGAAALIFGTGALYLYFHNPFEHPIPCVFYLLTGFFCPGCGSGRACYFILHGEFLRAFSYNPLMVIVLPFLGLYILVRGADWVLTGENHVDSRISVKFLVILLAVILVYGVLRNIPVFPFTILAPGGIAELL